MIARWTGEIDLQRLANELARSTPLIDGARLEVESERPGLLSSASADQLTLD